MSDKKISELTASTTPLAGTEVLPIVQSGITKKVSVSDLTAGRAISATEVTLTTGNLIIGTAGKGIDFSADSSAAGMTSELFDDYEEGSWTPSVGGDATYISRVGTYVKIGRQVTAYFLIRINVIGTGSATVVSGLPFTSGADNARGMGAITYFAGINSSNTWISPYVSSNSTNIAFIGQNAADGTATDSPSIFTNSAFVIGAVQYVV